MRRSATLVTVLTVLLAWTALYAQPAAPADLSPRGQQVFKMVGQVLTELQDGIDGNGGEINHGPVRIEESATNVAATIPKVMVIPGKNAPAIEIGTVKLVVTETGPNRDRVEFMLPDRIKLPEGGAVRIGQMRKTEMIWARELETAVGYDLDWRELAVLDEDSEVPIQIGTVRATMTLREGRPGRYSGPFNLTVSNLSATDDEGDSTVKISGLTVASEVVDWDVKGAKKMMAGKPGDPMAMLALLQELPKLAVKVTSTVSLSGLTVASVEQETGFSIDQMDFNFAFEDIDRPGARLALSYKHAGLSLEGMEDNVPEGFAPRRAALSLAVEKLPLAKLAEIASAAPPGGGPGAPPDPNAALDALAEASTGIRLDSLAIETEQAEAAADGLLTVQKGAAFGVVGGFDIRLRGLDAVIKELKELAGNQPDPVVGFLEATRKSGKPAGDALTYRLDVQPDGRIMLNGTDMAPLLGGGPPAAAPPRK